MPGGAEEGRLASGVIAKAVAALVRDAEKPAAGAAARDLERGAEHDAARLPAEIGGADGLDGLVRPGRYAGESIAARGPGRDWTALERKEIDRIGRETGCHRCGAVDPGTKAGHHVPDHQPPTQMAPAGTSQRLYPHCIKCSRLQGGTIASMTRKVGLR